MTPILIALRDPDVCSSLADLLREEGYPVVTASDQLATLDMIASHPGRLVVLLEWVSVIADHAVTDVLRAEHHLYERHAYILLSTGSVDSIPPSILQLQIPLLPMPFDLTELLDLIRSVSQRLLAPITERAEQ
jgi:DNA-binding NtrC family response regulator